MTQESLPGLAPQPGFRRVYCHCGCGVWFYHPRQKGRTRLFLNATHWRREKWKREKAKTLTASTERD